MFCKNCGSPLEEGARFCGECGKPIDSASVPEPQPVAEAPKQEPVVEIPEQEPVVEIPEQEPVVEIPEQKPVEDIPVQEPTPEPVEYQQRNTTFGSDTDFYVKKDVPKNTGKKILTGFLSAVICIFMFVFAFASLTMIGVRSGIEKSKVEKVVEDIDIKDIIESNEEVKDVLEYYIKPDAIDQILKKTTFDEYLASVISQYTDYVLGGDKPDGIKYKDIEKLVRKNESEIEEIFDFEMTLDDYNELERIFDEDIEDRLEMFEPDSSIDSVLKPARIICSIVVVVILVLITVLLFVLLLVARKCNINSLIWAGATFIASAVAFIVITTVSPIIKSFLPADKLVQDLVGSVLGASMWSFIGIGAIVIGAGAFLIAIAVVVKKIKNRKKA